MEIGGSLFHTDDNASHNQLVDLQIRSQQRNATQINSQDGTNYALWEEIFPILLLRNYWWYRR